MLSYRYASAPRVQIIFFYDDDCALMKTHSLIRKHITLMKGYALMVKTIRLRRKYIYIDDEGAVYALMCGSSLLMEECTLMDSYKIVDGRIYINGCL